MRLTLVTLIILAFGLGVFLLVACDIEEAAEDAVKDEYGDFEEDVTFEFEPVESTGGEEIQLLDKDCGTTSVNYELERHDISEDDVEIDEVTLRFVEARYSEASWQPPEVGSVSCVLTMEGDAGMVTVVEEDVDKNSGEWTEVNVSDAAQQFINYYLEHRDEEFSYCVVCTDADSYTVKYYVKIGVTVEGQII